MKYIIIFFCLLIFSCGSPSDKKSSESTKELITEADRLIFYRLSTQEFDSIAKLPNTRGLGEVDADFEYYVNMVVDSLTKTELKVEITTKRYIKIADQEIDKFDYIGYGVILIRADSINIQPGVRTDIDYFTFISDFY